MYICMYTHVYVCVDLCEQAPRISFELALAAVEDVPELVDVLALHGVC